MLDPINGSLRGLVLLSPILMPNSSPISVSITPDFIAEYVTNESGISSGFFTASATGGYGTKTYAWTILSQSGTGAVSIVTPTSSVTAFNYTGLYFSGAEVTATVQCTATDRLGATSFANATLTISQESYGSGEIPV